MFQTCLMIASELFTLFNTFSF